MNITVKIGGASGIGGDALLDELATYSLPVSGNRITIVHGGSDSTSRLQQALGREVRFLTSANGQVSRQTDRADVEIFAMATALIGKVIVEGLSMRGVKAFGLSGLDGGLAVGARKHLVRFIENGRSRILREQWTGRPETIDTGVLEALHGLSCVPVIAPVIASETGEMLNADGDRLAAAIAGRLGDETLVILTNVPGLMRDVSCSDSLISHIPTGDLETYMVFAEGRMRKKLLGAAEALSLGVRRVILADARVSNPLSSALAGNGTVIGERVCLEAIGATS
jgi:[amino group carrier protein]-L-2-aminoadipate 6-kinase